MRTRYDRYSTSVTQPLLGLTAHPTSAVSVCFSHRRIEQFICFHFLPEVSEEYIYVPNTRLSFNV